MPPEKINPYYEGLIESIKTTTTLIQELNKDLKSSEISQATLKTRIEQIEKDVGSLSHLLRDGNGEKSIITKVALMEDDIKDLIERDGEFRKFVYAKVEEFQEGFNVAKTLEEKKKTDKEERMEYKRSKILNILQILPGVVAVITVIIQYLLK